LELRGRGFDAALLFPNSFHAALIAFRAGIPERWGYRTGWRSTLLTRAIARAPAGVHQVDYYQQLVHALGFSNGPAEPRLKVTDVTRERGASALGGLGWDGITPLLAIAPGAAYGGAKRWPLEYYAELVRSFAADGVRTLMIGSAADAQVGHEIESLVGSASRALNAIGTPLPIVVGMLTHVRALVSNDSGAVHVGAAVGLPVTAVFGPTKEQETAPRGDRVSILSHPVWCRPCMLRECLLDHRCMRGVSVAAVVDASRRSP
jgi:heptosyltransferase-2